jgi:cytochrome b561
MRLQGYRLSSILLHWLAAVLMTALFFIGKAAKGVAPEPHHTLMVWHASLGLLAVFAILGRLAWRFVARDGAADRVAAPGLARAAEILATAIKHLLYLDMLVVIVAGPLTMWASGRGISFFELFAVPSPYGKLAIHDLLGEVHSFAATMLAPLVLLHVLGALKHLIIDRDGVFQRMLVPRG